ncbi:MAG: methylated-DNA--[protein]-cysteine S-methyltransferase [Rhodococcus sp. (in: high G+C Gram-positive bacteria)]
MPYALFDTALGTCGIAWSEHGITAVELPEATGDIVGEPNEVVAHAIAAVQALLDGRAVDLSTIPVVLDVSDFDRAVYDVARAIAFGSVLTYGAVAAKLGRPGAAQAVGGALGRNPVPIIVPCHRVLGSGRAVGGFSAPGGVNAKRRILAIEGVAGFGEATLF